jgi:hypothetical protein
MRTPVPSQPSPSERDLSVALSRPLQTEPLSRSRIQRISGDSSRNLDYFDLSQQQ